MGIENKNDEIDDNKKLDEKKQKEQSEKLEQQNIVKWILDFTPGSPESEELKNKDWRAVLKAFQEETKNKSSNLNDEQKKQI